MTTSSPIFSNFWRYSRSWIQKCRSHFEKGLLPSLAETLYMFATPRMTKNEIKTLALKISEVKKLTLVNKMSRDNAFMTTQQYPCQKCAN